MILPDNLALFSKTNETTLWPFYNNVISMKPSDGAAVKL
jgi:hypothetical protein